MSNLRDAYLDRACRLTRILGWMQALVDCHADTALVPANAGDLPRLIAELRTIEADIMPALWFLSKMTLAEIEEELSEGGQDNE